MVVLVPGRRCPPLLDDNGGGGLRGNDGYGEGSSVLAIFPRRANNAAAARRKERNVATALAESGQIGRAHV